jgi:hypothetical protein
MAPFPLRHTTRDAGQHAAIVELSSDAIIGELLDDGKRSSDRFLRLLA